MKKTIIKIIKTLLAICVVLTLTLLAGNGYVKLSQESHILKSDYPHSDCILILGAGVKANGEPSLMLKERLDRGIELYKQGVSDKLLMSGDHGTKEYDEVNIMKTYAIKAGVPSSDIFMDHAGFSTYDSMVRAKQIFNVKSMIVVTQEYHQYRALYIANHMGIKAYGSVCDQRQYKGWLYRDIREILARNKDIISVVMNKRAMSGEQIDIHGNGDITND